MCSRCGLTPALDADAARAPQQINAFFERMTRSGCQGFPRPVPQLSGSMIRCFWCGVQSCAAHWLTYTVFDHGYYDGIDGICPAGHHNAEIRR